MDRNGAVRGLDFDRNLFVEFHHRRPVRLHRLQNSGPRPTYDVPLVKIRQVGRLFPRSCDEKRKDFSLLHPQTVALTRWQVTVLPVAPRNIRYKQYYWHNKQEITNQILQCCSVVIVHNLYIFSISRKVVPNGKFLLPYPINLLLNSSETNLSRQQYQSN